MPFPPCPQCGKFTPLRHSLAPPRTPPCLPTRTVVAHDQRSKILVVDDDPAFTAFLTEKLHERYELVITNRSTEALDLAERIVPDLVLCGIDMPEPDGYEVCRRLKANAAVADVPVLFVTSASTTENEARGFEVGGADYIHKPVEPRVLEARMQTQLALRDQAARLEVMVAERTAQVEQSRAALRGAMHNLRTTVVTTGVYWVQVPEAGLYILCGSPADVVKHLMLRGYIVEEMKDGVMCETGPNVILLSDVLVQNGRFANLAEFPVLQMLYRQGLLIPGHPNNTGRKPMLIGSGQQVRAQLDYIYRGNYGLVSEEELMAAGLDKEEARQQMAIKMAFAFGKIRPSEDLLDVREIGPEAVELANGVTAKRLGLNRYAFEYQRPEDGCRPQPRPRRALRRALQHGPPHRRAALLRGDPLRSGRRLGPAAPEHGLDRRVPGPLLPG